MREIIESSQKNDSEIDFSLLEDRMNKILPFFNLNELKEVNLNLGSEQCDASSSSSSSFYDNDSETSSGEENDSNSANSNKIKKKESKKPTSVNNHEGCFVKATDDPKCQKSNLTIASFALEPEWELKFFKHALSHYYCQDELASFIQEIQARLLSEDKCINSTKQAVEIENDSTPNCVIIRTSLYLKFIRFSDDYTTVE